MEGWRQAPRDEEGLVRPEADRRLGPEPLQLGGWATQAAFSALFIATVIGLRGSARILALIALFAVYLAVVFLKGYPPDRADRE